MSNKAKIDLSISSTEIRKCKDIAKYLSKMGIISKVVSNWSVVEKLDKKYEIEKGCNISLFNLKDKDIETIWNPLKNKYNLKCAHLKIDNKYEGCILDYVKEKN